MSRRIGRRPGHFAPLVIAAGSASSRHQDVELDVMDESEMDFPIEELHEFLSADLFDVPADPAFKEALREKLWEMIQSQSFGYGRPPKN
jgi:hypothetical protein